MKTFKIFKNPSVDFQYEVVKIGFSWPGFFFSFFWAFSKKLYIHAFAIIGTLLLLGTIEKAFEKEQSAAGAMLMTLFQLGVFIVIGVKGNEWRAVNLQKHGFELVDTLQAETADAARRKVWK